MTLKKLLAVDALLFVVAALTWVVLAPTNFDAKDPSPVYIAAWLLGIASLVVLVVVGLVALARHFANPS